MRHRLALNTVLSPVFTRRWVALARSRLDGAARRRLRRPVQRPELAIFGAETGPVHIGGATAAQPDSVTCAATGLTLLNAACDPALAAWLEHGTRPQPRPPELLGLTTAELDASDPARRLALAAAAVHDRATRRTLGPFRWPRAYGTPPWGVAREARVPGVVYAHRAVDDRDGALMDDVLAMIVTAAGAGIPVPIYAGGDLAHGWQTAVPRHLVLVLPSGPDLLRIYEPGRGSIGTIPPEHLRARTRGHAALGGWTHLAWTLVPIVR